MNFAFVLLFNLCSFPTDWSSVVWLCSVSLIARDVSLVLQLEMAIRSQVFLNGLK